MKTLRHTLTTLSLALTTLLTPALTTGCQDDPLFSAPGYDGETTTKAEPLTNPGALQKDGNGLWVATERVPLVGVGRVADDISENFLNIIDLNSEGCSLDNVFDDNLENFAKVKSSVADANLFVKEGLCVRDLYRTYRKGQKVGFVIGVNNASLLSVEVLTTIWIATSNDGVNWETVYAGGSQKQGLLNLELLSPKGSNIQTIQVEAKNDFNRVKFGFGEVTNLSLLSELKIYYAFVGENPIKPITTETFKDAKAGGSTLIFNKNQLINDKLEDGPGFGIINFGGTHFSVDFGDTPEIPAGAEVGFCTSNGGLLGLGIFNNTKLEVEYKDGSGKEETMDTSVLGLSLLSGGENMFSMTTDKNKHAKSIEITFNEVTGTILDILLGLEVNLGWTTVHYAYYRDPVTIDPSAYFGLPEHITVTGSSYQLPTPEKGSVSYSIATQGPANADIDSDNKLYGMTMDGDYTIHAVYTTENGEEIAYDMIVTKDSKEVPECHVPITTTRYRKAKIVENAEGTGWLLNVIDAGIDKDHTADKLIDSNTNNYAGSLNVLSLAGNEGIVAIDAGELIGEDVLGPNGTSGKKIRAGFVMQTSNALLNLQALKFYRVKLLDENRQEVATGGATDAADANNTVSLSLLGGDGSKIRYSIETEKPFRYIELYASGIIGLEASLLRIYYAFWEDTSSEACQDVDKGYIPGDACTSMMTAANNNLSIWYEETANQALINIQGYYADLGNAIDDDRNSAATIVVPVNVTGEATIGFKFDALQGGQPIGILLHDPDNAIEVNALTTKPSIECYYQGVSTGDETGGNFEVLTANVISFGGYVYLEVTPDKNKKVDGMVVTLTSGLLNLFSTFQICGIYYRPDLNQNGIPDCSDEVDETPAGINIDLATTHVCVGDPITINATAGVGTPNQDVFYLAFRKAGAATPEVIPVAINESRGQLVASGNTPLLLNEYGVYSVALYKAYNENGGLKDEDKISANTLVLTVHSETTKWQGGTGHDWNTWDNWSQGTPWTCTDVTIPGGLGDNYPWLDKDGANYCRNLYIENGGQLVNSFYLDYSGQVWVDVTLQGGRYYMLTSPLKDMVSGDWFINATGNLDGQNKWIPFNTLNVVTYPEKRTNPTIYQRLWSTNAPVKNPDGYGNYSPATEVGPDETRWTPPYNSVAQEYPLGMGFSLMADKETGNSYTFHFPKAHNVFHYYNLMGDPTGQTEDVHPSNSNIGRFVYEDDSNNNWKEGTVTFAVQATKEDETARLVGNPFVAHVNLKLFMTQNGIKEIKVFDGNTNNSLILVDGELLSSNGNTLGYIKPMEAFFVMDYDKEEVTYTADMLNSGSGTAFTRSSTPAAHPPSPQRLTAALGGTQSHALLRVSPDASAGAVPGEDTRLLIEGEARPAVAVYTVADGQALDIQQVPGGPATIPLGFYLRDGGKADIRLTLDFTGSQWTDWFLVDQHTGQRRRITHTTLTLNGVENGSGQYALMKNEK